MDALHVHGTRRAVSYELLTYWSPGGAVFPSVLTLSQGMGKKPRCVRAHLAALDRIGLWKREAREGETNIYDLRLPGVAPSAPKQPTSEPSTHLRAVDEKPVVSTSEGGTPVPGGAVPECRGGRHPSAGISNQRSNQEKSTSSGGARNVCENCTNDWPASYGPKCYTCGHNPSTRLRADEPKARPTEHKAPRPDHPTLTPERLAELEAEAFNNGYRKRDGRWARYQADETDTGPFPRTPPGR